MYNNNQCYWAVVQSGHNSYWVSLWPIQWEDFSHFYKKKQCGSFSPDPLKGRATLQPWAADYKTGVQGRHGKGVPFPWTPTGMIPQGLYTTALFKCSQNIDWTLLCCRVVLSTLSTLIHWLILLQKKVIRKKQLSSMGKSKLMWIMNLRSTRHLGDGGRNASWGQAGVVFVLPNY